MNAARSRAARALLTFALLCPAVARAQAGPWVPIGSPLDGLTGWLIADGALQPLDPLTRPYRLASVRAAVTGQDTASLSAAATRALSWLRDELDRVADSTQVLAEAGLATYRNGRRDSFREGGQAGTAPMLGVWVQLKQGPIIAVLNPAIENRLKDDPEFTGKTDRVIAGRLQSGYLALTGERGDLILGRTARNWGPAPFDGLQLSPSAYATDQVVGSVRLGRFELTTMAQRLDDYDTTLSAVVTRWFLAHRLTVRAGRGVWLAFSETGIYGGPGRGFEPAFHMPLGPALLAEFNEQRQVNLLWGAELHAPLGRRVTLEAQGAIDDIQVDGGPANTRPWSGGLSVVLRGAFPALPIHVAMGYTSVRSLTYRNSFAPWELYTSSGVGIARNYADYDQLLLRAEYRPSARLFLSAEAMYLRQGSADFRQPFPADSVLALPGMGFLVEPVQHLPGARLTATGELRPGVELRGELGALRRSSGATEAIAALALTLGADLLHRRWGAPFPAIERSTQRW